MIVGAAEVYDQDDGRRALGHADAIPPGGGPSGDRGAAVPLREEMAAFRRETNAHFDKIFKLLDRVDLKERIAELENDI